jgi:hypothetical protein
VNLIGFEAIDQEAVFPSERTETESDRRTAERKKRTASDGRSTAPAEGGDAGRQSSIFDGRSV